MKTKKQFQKHLNAMKNFKNILGTILMLAFLTTSCSNNDDNDGNNGATVTPPTTEAFHAIKEAALEELTQNFQFNTEDGHVELISENGVKIYFNSACLTLDGESVTGTIDIEYVELFDKGSMLVTNKPTMGTLPNGDKALLISGGEFYVNATQNGADLETTCGFQMLIPGDLTGGVDEAMTLWTGNIDEEGNLVWDEVERDGPQGEGGIFGEGTEYYGFFQSFGWSNVDRFYNDPRPKTTILVAVPDGYDNTNSAVYISYDGEDAGLAHLDTYITETGLFSEHYGQIPIGLECHIIFATEEDDNWKYAIKAVTIAENDVITFTEEETSIATEEQLTIIINDLP